MFLFDFTEELEGGGERRSGARLVVEVTDEIFSRNATCSVQNHRIHRKLVHVSEVIMQQVRISQVC